MSVTALYQDDVVEITDGMYVARELILTPAKAKELWDNLNRFRTLFSDLTRGDMRNFIRFATEPYSIWFEVTKDNTPIGIVCFNRMERVIDTDAHIVFFDGSKQLTDKAPILQKIVKWMFKTFPLQRITAEAPRFYYATVRLIQAVGLKVEGEKSCAALIGGRWANVQMFGITRVEADRI